MEFFEMHNGFISRFARTSRQAGIVVVFHQLHPMPLYLRADRWDGLSNGVTSDALLEILKENKIVADEQTDANELRLFRHEAARTLSRPSILYLMLAQGCNNACTYCPIPKLAELHGNTLLSFEDGVAGIELWLKHIQAWGNDDEPYSLLFYGGEPLLNKEVFIRLVEFVSARKNAGTLLANIDMWLPTNGLLIDETLARFLKAHGIKTVIGTDGRPEDNDRTRLTSDGASTSSRIEKAVQLLVRHGVEVGASATLTPRTVTESQKTREYLEFLGIRFFGFNVLKGAALQKLLGNMAAQEYYRLATQAVLEGYDNANISDYQLTRKIRALAQSKPFGVDCTCFGNQIVVQADGQVTNCPFLRVDMCHVRKVPEGFSMPDTPVVQAWRKNIPLLQDESERRYESHLHAGGCAFGVSDAKGAVAYDYGNEIFTTELVNGIIWKQLPDNIRSELLNGELDYWYCGRIGSV